MSKENARTGWFFRDGEPPNDNAYFENMSRAVFQAGLSWEMIANKWSAFKRAFKDFDIETVSTFDEEDIERLLSDKSIIRNRSKIEAVIVNAMEFVKIKEEYENFRNYMDTLDKSENYKFVKKELGKRFSRMGPKSAMIYLYSIGENIQHED